jgi:16S rRNA (adenine1518-N6/adenine1519-N6)-dimethyltransferase
MRQRLGQHFLINRAVLSKIAGAALCGSPDLVVEIGSGHGELTEQLRGVRCKVVEKKQTDKSGDGIDPKIVAVEKDPRLAAVLRRKFAGDGRIEIIEGDIRKLLPSLASPARWSFSEGGHLACPPELQRRWAPRTYNLVGNLPYYLTSFLFRIVSELPHKPDRCVFMVQKEVAERLAATPPRMNKLSASVQYWGLPRVLFDVPARDFSPPPEVASSVIEITALTDAPDVDEKNYYSTVRAVFKQPRKTVLNNLREGFPNESAEYIASLLVKAGIDPSCRPQNLDVGSIKRLAAGLYHD